MSLLSTRLPNNANPRLTPRIFFLGEVGTGKTTVFNKITEQNRSTAAGGASVTHSAEEALSSSAIAPDLRMRVVDTPGTSSFGQKLEHAITLKLTMTTGSYNQIFVFTRFGRDGAIAENLKKQLMIVKDYLPMVTVVVTHFDLSENKEDNFQTILSMLRRTYKIEKLICTEKGTQAFALINAFFMISASEVARRIEIPDRVFKFYFDVTEIDWDKDIDLAEMKELFKKELSLHQQLVTKMSQATDKKISTNKDLIVFSSYSKLIELSQFLCIEFGKKHADIMLENGYAYYLHLKMALNDMVEAMVQFYEDIIKEDIRKLTNSPYRRCPHCGLVWVKPQGCDGSTTCGSRPDVVDVSHMGFLQAKFVKKSTGTLDLDLVDESCTWIGFELVEGSIQYRYGTRKVPPKTPPGSYDTQKFSAVGCGKQIKWSEMPLLTNEDLKALTSLENTQFYADADVVSAGEKGWQKRIEELVRSFGITLFS